VVSQQISIDYLCQEMSSEEMFPERYQEFYQEQNEELEKIEAHKKQLDSTVGMFKCGRCKSNKTTYYQLQTRSAKIGHIVNMLVKFYNFATLSNCGESLRAFTTKFILKEIN
jgi:DNA-directed RNA polymerase subunit M/transcription elongation factor TFIIS